MEGSPLRLLTTKKPGTSRVSTSDEEDDIAVQRHRNTRTEGIRDSSFFPIFSLKRWPRPRYQLCYVLSALASVEQQDEGFNVMYRRVLGGIWGYCVLVGLCVDGIRYLPGITAVSYQGCILVSCMQPEQLIYQVGHRAFVCHAIVFFWVH